MRIFELGKQLDIPSKELIELAEMLGIEVKNHMSGLTPPQVAEMIEAATGDAPNELPVAPTSSESDVPAAATEVLETEAAPEEEAPVADEPEEPAEPEGPQPVEIFGPIVVKELAALLEIKPNHLIAELMKTGVFASINQSLDQQTAKKLAVAHGREVLTSAPKPPPPPPPEPEPDVEPEAGADAATEAAPAVEGETPGAAAAPRVVAAPKKRIKKKKKTKKASGGASGSDGDDDEPSRPPVITFLGHVDHGKTSLVDRIRSANVVSGEAGGITQHIGAYTVSVGGKEITILDTPGHAAFTAMRARGANLTDIAIIVIAADDGIKPQTLEAIQHAQAAGVELLVAANKIDKPNASADKVRTDLQKEGLATVDWGGTTEMIPVSAMTGEGIDELLEMVALQADMLELTASVTCPATGYVIEAQLETGMGPTASVLVSEGILRVGDSMLVGDHWAKVKALIDHNGKRVKSAGPSHAVKILGLSDVPVPGQQFEIVKDDRVAKKASAERQEARRTTTLAGPERTASLDDLFEAAGLTDTEELRVIIKCDVQGSLEALKESLLLIESDKVKLKIITSGIGKIGENDVLLASASDAILIGFNVPQDAASVKVAKREGVEVRTYEIIYNLLDDVRAAMTGLLKAVPQDNVIGHAEIRAIFKLNKAGNVAGSMVIDGRIRRDVYARVLRGREEIFKGPILSLKRFQDEVAVVGNGQECGIRLNGFNDFATGDVIEVFETEMVAQQL